MHPGHLLDEVLLDGDIETEGRRRYLPALVGRAHLVAQAFQDAAHLAVVQRDAEYPGQSLPAQRHGGPRRQPALVSDLRDRAGRAAGDLGQQGRGAFDGPALTGRIHAALEAHGGIGVQTEVPCPAGDRLGREEGTLQQDVDGVFANRRGGAAHDAGEADGSAVVRDDQHILIHLYRAAVQQFEGLSRGTGARLYRTLQQAEIVAVQRLPVLQQHVIRDIHHGVDGADAAAPQPLLHPQRRARPGVDAAYHPADEPGTALGREHPNGMGVVRGRGHRRHGRVCQRRAGEGRDLTRHAEDAEAVATVRRQVDIDDGVRQAEQFAERHARRRVCRQFHDAVGFLTQAQFGDGAKHSRRLDAPQLRPLQLRAVRQHGAGQRQGRAHAGAHVRRPADDLRLLAAGGYAADAEPVGVRMRAHGQHLADHDALQPGTEALCAVHFQPGQRQALDQCVCGQIGIHPAAQPCLADLHRPANCSRKARSLSKNVRRSRTS